MKCELCNKDKSGAYTYFNEYIDDIEIMRGSIFKTNEDKDWKSLTMQMKGQK